MKRISVIFFLLSTVLSLSPVFNAVGQTLIAGIRGDIKAEDNIPVTEEIYVHTDRNKYVAGEDLWLSIYNINSETGKPDESSSLAYVELLNPWNEPVIQKRFRLSGGRGEGILVLPDSISSGTYILRAYTNWMKNILPDYCFVQDVGIFNPFKGTDFYRNPGFINSRAASKLKKSDPSSMSAVLTIDSVYGRREKVILKLMLNNYIYEEQGITEMSVSVAPATAASASPWLNDFPAIGNYQHKYNYENDGHYLSGTVKYRENSMPDSSRFLYMSIQGKVAEFKYAEIDSAGQFTLILPLDNKPRTLILQPEHAGNNMILEIEPSFPWRIPESPAVKDNINDHQYEFYSELSFNYQAAKIYGTGLKIESETESEDLAGKRRFYGIPEMEILLDEYIKLPSIQEVFFELVPGIIIRPANNGYVIKITNPLTGKFYNEPPLVMIDGVIINDLNVLVDLDPELVEKIEVVKTPYLIGDLILHGIVNVITRSGDFSDITMPDYAVILPYRVLETQSAFFSPDYTPEQNRKSRKPDLRNTLYWNPSVKTDRKGEAGIEFWTSDNPGLYTVSVQGISVNGKKISLYRTFRVK